jgi:hypothetical protein
MLELYKQTLTNQYEAALTMLRRCIEGCPDEHWESKIAQGTFRWVAYHTLFFTDLYLSPSNDAFELRDFHQHGGDEREPFPAPGLSKEETLAYIPLCRQKAIDSVAAETETSLAGPSGFFWYEIARSEMHLVNIRHVQHHTGQMSAFLRRVDDRFKDHKELRWVGSGWH